MRIGERRATLGLFAAALILFLIMGRYFPAELAIPLSGSEIRPVLLFEFATQPQHLIHVFGTPDDPQRAMRIAGMNTGNLIDYLFMPVYGLFTLSFFTSLAARLGGSIWRLFGWMGVAAAVADGFENALLLSITGNMNSTADALRLLPYPVWTKFALLAVTCAGAAWGFIALRRWLLALLCLPAPLLFIPGWLDPFGIGPTATATIGLGWLAMALHATTSEEQRASVAP